VSVADGVWAVGLFKTAAGEPGTVLYAELKIDRTGRIVGRRFDR
jgi:hypothetical protein